MTGAARALVLTGLLSAAACGSSRITDPPPDNPASTFSCTDPLGLLLHHDDGLSGHYVVVLRENVPDVEAAARDIAQRYGGTVTTIYPQGLPGFAILIDDAKAAEVAKDPAVCWVEQQSSGEID